MDRCMYHNEYNNRLIDVAKSEYPTVRQFKKLLFKGANLNYQTAEHGYNALMFLVKAHHDRMVEYLLRQGANPLLKNHENKIASNLISPDSSIYPILKDFELLFATTDNDLSTVKLIIAEGALVNFQGIYGYTSLMIAVEQNLVEMVELLLAEGADLSLTCMDGQNVFDLVTDSHILCLLKEANNLGKGIQVYTEKYSHYFFGNSLST